MKPERIVVVGASIAGVTAAASIRAEGWAGRLTVIGAEHSPPYSRVPLSKGVLAGTQHSETVALPPLPDDVDLRLGDAAVGLDPSRRQVVLADGSSISYDGLVIATGARARRLAGRGQRGELVVRDLSDAERIAERLQAASTAVVVGGGFLGMEVGSTLLRHGLQVTMVDTKPPLARILGPWLSAYVGRVAEDSGIHLLLCEGRVALDGDPVSGVRIDGERIEPADLVVSAAGDLPNVEWLTGSGLRLSDGVVVDDRCRAAPDIVAAGDVVSREIVPGVHRRTPHWSNAVAQARAAAIALLNPDAPRFVPDEYFWTELFGLDVKIAGRLPLVGDPDVVDGDPALRSALLRWTDGGRTTAAVAINYRLAALRLRRMVSK
jgi:NADPH-dependent 2,4-dienoyl-CoA reductase/sulfur reductase-like enzyme